MPQPARRPPQPTRRLPQPLRWLVGLGPVQSWLVVMGVIIGLNLVGLRVLAWVVAVTWLAFAVYTWMRPSMRRRQRPRQPPGG